MLIVLLGLIKLPIAALLLWMPFRSDHAMDVPAPPDQSEDDGGSKTPRSGPIEPHPRTPLGGPLPRRGPHGTPAPRPPRRVRGGTVRVGERSSGLRLRAPFAQPHPVVAGGAAECTVPDRRDAVRVAQDHKRDPAEQRHRGYAGENDQHAGV
jgi:hypothetical protein